jgi:hypothetical protein
MVGVPCFLHLPIQTEVTHGLTHLHATQQVDDALSPPQRDEQRHEHGHGRAERDEVEHPGTRNTEPIASKKW